MSSPATLELEELLKPIVGTSPTGESLRYTPAYDAIQEARKSDDPNLNQGEWRRELKVTNWREVTRLTVEALSNKSKDLQLSVWLTEALVKQFGFAGLRDELRFLRELLEKYWEILHPIVDSGDLEDRIGPIEWLNDKLPPALRSIDLTTPAGAGEAYSWLHWQESRMVEELGRKNPQLKEAAIAEGKIAGDQFDKAVAATPKDFYEAVEADLSEGFEESEKLASALVQRFGEDAPSLAGIKCALEDCRGLLEQIISKKGGLHPRSAGPPANGALVNRAATAPIAVNSSASLAPNGGAVITIDALPLQPTDRADALHRLEAVADFFRRTEPHSPVAYLVQRAVRWGQMPLEQWLKEVIHDQNVLTQLHDTLGIENPQQKD